MTNDEAYTILTRAAEGGYFDEAGDRWSRSVGASREEAEAYRDLYRLAWALVGKVLPTINVCRYLHISDVIWRDYIKYGKWPEVLDIDDIPDDLLDLWVERAHPLRPESTKEKTT